MRTRRRCISAKGGLRSQKRRLRGGQRGIADDAHSALSVLSQPFPGIEETSLHRTVAFDVYGTLFDLARLTASCEETWPGYGQTLADMWRRKQLEYSWQRSLMRRYAPFDVVTREALEYSCKVLGVELNSASKHATMSAYAQLAPY